MVFVWSNLSDGEPQFTPSQVPLNDVTMVFAFAPIVALLLGLSAITVPWETPLPSVGLYIVVPVILVQIARRAVLASGGDVSLVRLLTILQPIFFLLACSDINSGTALATVVAVLIEVRVMVSVIKIVNSSRGWHEAGAAVKLQKVRSAAAAAPR
jgi:ACR3 family arsenite efflux pump ArsB